MRRFSFFIAAGLVAGTIGFAAGAAHQTEECVIINRVGAACASVSEVDPVEARAGATGPHGTSSAHLGFARGKIPVDGACGRVDTQRPPLPVPLPDIPSLPQPPVPLPGLPISCHDAVFGLYEIDARTGSPAGTLFVHGEGTPVPCTTACRYTVSVGAGVAGGTSTPVCYSIVPPNLRC